MLNQILKRDTFSSYKSFFVLLFLNRIYIRFDSRGRRGILLVLGNFNEAAVWRYIEAATTLPMVAQEAA
jgi:hypothetical protein